MRVLLASGLCWTVIVLAAPASADVATSATLEKSPENNCSAKYYPTSAINAGEQGATSLDIHVDETGKPTEVDTVASSGFADLDEASQKCVMKGWHFKPATDNGKPVASIKKFRIVWKLAADDVVPYVKSPVENACEDIFSDAPNRWPNYESAALQFRITAGGAISHPFVAVSSGDELFDLKAMKCVTRLKYTAPIIDGLPAEISWSSAFRWSPHTGIAYTDFYRLGNFCSDALFPLDLWKGDPLGSTVVSFHVIQDGLIVNAAIEQTSGNPALDQAALQCVSNWRTPVTGTTDPEPDFGEVVRITWRDGHAFVLEDTWK